MSTPTLVTTTEFTRQMNMFLQHHARYQFGMAFIETETGLEFFAPMLDAISRSGLNKDIYDEVSKFYTIVK